MSVATDLYAKLPANTPVIIGTGQASETLTPESLAPFLSPARLAAAAALAALADAGAPGAAAEIDTLALVRTFADSSPAVWPTPFGRSNNLPESVARLIGAKPRQRIYSSAGGTQPLQLLHEAFTGIEAGEQQLVLIGGAEAIASERRGLRQQLEDDWEEQFDAELDEREYRQRMVSAHELAGGLKMPTHYYAVIENLQAHERGHSLDQHRAYMGRMLSRFSAVAADNPHALQRKPYSAQDLAQVSGHNYPLSLPYTRNMVAQDGVNQGAALVLASVGKARELGINPRNWIFLNAYAEGEDGFLSQRPDPSRSEAMTQVFEHVLEALPETPAQLELIDLYSCFPSAVTAACELLALAPDGPKPLTVTGGLPFFGGPGNNYAMHALAEFGRRLRGHPQAGLITTNGGMLSKHAVALMSCRPGMAAAKTQVALAPQKALIEVPCEGRVVSYTLVERRGKSPRAVILGETINGERFVAASEVTDTVRALCDQDPIDRPVTVDIHEQWRRFRFA